MFVEWRKMCLVLTTVLLSVGTTAASNTCDSISADANWHSIYSDEILTLYEPNNRSGPPTLSARIHWPASPESLYQIIWDYERFREHIPHVEESKVLQANEGHKWVYQRLNLPGPIQDRHYILESTNLDSRPDRRLYRVEWQLSDRFTLPTRQLVRPATFSGCWHIRPGTANGLDALYRIRLDPAGNVPRWMARAGMRHYVKQLMERLHNLLQSPAVR
ncbi:hypothetical protein MNBD_GAMMA14-1572 [hydrothermal vent metagenome]|uniref:Coenzyme Q-binding protein COQ10 START domain-containing protein n=1 Tax=hydrothermal vent metagenome TaxID=652676 RepID=A0A3B0YNV6_9ZZZZ